MRQQKKLGMIAFGGVLIWMSVCLFLILPAEAEKKGKVTPTKTSSAGGRYWALLIAIDDYKDNRFLSDLPTCRADADAVKQILKANYGYTEFIELYDAQASGDSMKETLARLSGLLGDQDFLLIYFSGHGNYDEKTKIGCWYPYDASREVHGISNSTIRDYVNAIPARHVLIVADSCFSGSLLVKGSTSATDWTRKSRQLLAAGGIHPVSALSSIKGCEKHSIFACYFLKALTTQGSKSPLVKLNDIFADLYPGVKNNSEQEPRIGPIASTGDEGGEFAFISISNPPPPPPPSPEVVVIEELKPRTYAKALKISSNPSGADIYINDIDQNVEREIVSGSGGCNRMFGDETYF